MSNHNEQLIAAAKAEDTYDLLCHIAWTDVIKPKLEEQVKRLSSQLVAEALGKPLPEGLTRERVAGMCYGIQYITSLFEKILKDGERAVKDLKDTGISLG